MHLDSSVYEPPATTRIGRTHVMQEFTMKQAELEKVHVKIVQLMAEQRKLNAEAGNNKDIP